MPFFDIIEQFVRHNELALALDELDNHISGLLTTYRDRLTLLRAELNRINEEHLLSTPNQIKADKAKLGQDILTLGREYDMSIAEVESSYNKLQDLLLADCKIPFLNRSSFRQLVKAANESNDAAIILVNGPTQSGMSYLEKILEHSLAKANIVDFISINVENILDEPDISFGELLAMDMAIELEVDRDFTELPGNRLKFKQFFVNLKNRILKSNKVPIIFLHDFHKVQEDDPSLLRFMKILIDNVLNNFPKSIFVIAGLNYELLPKWSGGFEYTLHDQLYNIEPVTLEDIKACLSSVFNQYSDKIVLASDTNEITEEEYIEQMLPEIIGSSNIVNIADVGNNISDHLKKLNSM